MKSTVIRRHEYDRGAKTANVLDLYDVSGPLGFRLYGLFAKGEPHRFILMANGEAPLTFEGLVYAVFHGSGDKYDRVTIRISKFLPQEVRVKTPTKIVNKFYCAAPSVTSEREQRSPNTCKVHLARRPSDRGGMWTRHTMQGAIDHATQILEDDPNKDHVAIVQIVKIVRRKSAPIIVENVRG